MHIILGVRSGDKEEQMYRRSVEGVKLHTVLYDHGGKSWSTYGLGFAVGNCDSVTDSGRSFLFSGKDTFAVCFNIVDFSTLNHKVDHFVQHIGFIGGCPI